MQICIVGTGYVGLVSGVCLAKIGHTVTCVDIDESKVSKLTQGKPTIHEDGLEELLKEQLSAKKISFTNSLREGLKDAQVLINAVGTPPDKDRKADLKYVKQVAKQTAEIIDHDLVFVNKSTVPVGTAEMVASIIEINKKNDCTVSIASNPEFLREGVAIADFMDPDRIVIGTDSEFAETALKELYKPLTDKGAALVSTDVKSSELIKYAANSFLAIKLSFINEIANLCEAVGSDIKEVSRGIGLDSRIGMKFLTPGPGYGGSCFPKDTDSLLNTSYEYGVTLRVVEAARDANIDQQLIAVQKLRKHFDTLVNKTIAIWGIAFKPDTDDVRESSSIKVINELLRMGAHVIAYDPVAIENAKSYFTNGDSIEFRYDMYQSLEDIDALIIMTHWAEFINADKNRVIIAMEGNLIIDCRNIWDKKSFNNSSVTYEGLGY